MKHLPPITALSQCLFILIFAYSSNFILAQKFDNLAPTPPMGWNSWNHFACDINEKIIRDVADAISFIWNERRWLYLC